MKNRFGHTLSTEFGKVIWPKKGTAGKQILMVIVTVIILGVLINYLDTLIRFLVGLAV